MDSIENVITERGLYERTIQTKDRMANLIVKKSSRTRSEKQTDSSRSGNDTHVGDGVISKAASEIGNTVAGDSHDNDNITKVQSSANEMCEKILRSTKHASEMFKKTKTEHKMLKAENDLLKNEIKEYKERVRDFNEKQYIEKLEQENHKLQDQVLKEKSECLMIKQYKDKYATNILQLEAKNKDLENTVCKMGKSCQTLRMLTNEQSLYRENQQKMGLGYTNPCPLSQAIACHPKLYDAKVLGLHYVKPDVHDTEEILNDAETSQVKMKEKQFQFNYENINILYDTFIPQTELSPDQEYFSKALISSETESSKEMSDLPVLKMPKESRLLKIFNTIGDAITGLHTRINKTLLQDAERRWLSDSQNELMKFYKTNVILMSRSLYKNLKGIKEELIEEVQEMLNIFESMESKVDRTSKKNEILQNKIDQLLEANIANDVKNLVMQSYVEIKNNEEIKLSHPAKAETRGAARNGD
ncbi:hypothetical protein Tco_0033369 [Tanacetum coccineum]